MFSWDNPLIFFLWVSSSVLPLVCDLVTFSRHDPTISFCVSGSVSLLVENLSFCTDLHWISYLTRIYCISSVDICYEIHPLNSYLYVHWILDFKQLLLIITSSLCISFLLTLQLWHLYSCTDMTLLLKSRTLGCIR